MSEINTDRFNFKKAFERLAPAKLSSDVSDCLKLKLVDRTVYFIFKEDNGELDNILVR